VTGTGVIILAQDVNIINEIKGKLGKTTSNVLVNMVMTLTDPRTSAAVRVRIYEIILDRLMGKPEATIRLEDNMGEMEEAEQFVARLAEEIRAEMKERKSRCDAT
jgi:hypothetical protein